MFLFSSIQYVKFLQVALFAFSFVHIAFFDFILKFNSSVLKLSFL